MYNTDILPTQMYRYSKFTVTDYLQLWATFCNSISVYITLCRGCVRDTVFLLVRKTEA